MRPTSLSYLGFIVGILLVGLWWGCSTGTQSRTGPSPVPRAERPFFVPTDRGYPLALTPEVEDLLGRIFIDLTQDGDLAAADAASERLLAENPGFHPAWVIAAQIDFLRQDYLATCGRLRPVVEELPSYTAAQLLMGRCSEKLGELPRAFDSYWSVAGVDSTAAERAAELGPRTIEILDHRITDSLNKGHVEEAAHELERLQAWAPEEDLTLWATANVAAATEDAEAELGALRLLVERYPLDRQLLERQAERELEVGDPSLGLRSLQALASEYPDDPQLAEKLALAKFRWRLQLLPEEVRILGELPELTRGEFASLLYWLFPDIRYGRPDEARIASDVLDHPHRHEIVRVINLGLMDLDADLHAFEPNRPATQIEVLTSLAMLLNRHRPPLACVGEPQVEETPSMEYVCRVTARCGILPSESDCLPTSSISGQTALQMCRWAQDQLGIQ